MDGMSEKECVIGRQIPEFQDLLARLSSDLLTAITTLEERLSSVLVEQAPEIEDDVSERNLVPLAKCLRDIATTYACCLSKITDIESRLQL